MTTSHVFAVSRSFKTITLASFALLVGGCTHLLAAGFTISPDTISNSYSGNITFVITGIPSGATVRLEQFVDLDNNGVIDPTDLLVTSFQVTDGQVTAFGGVTDANIPGDQDAVAGQITTSFSFPNSAEASRVTGPHLFRLSSPSGAFSSVVQPFTVTSTPYSQSVTGKVTNAGATVSNVFVGLLVLSGANNADFFAGTLTDSAGTYSLPAPAGIYFMFTFKAGLVGGFGSPQISINTNQTLSQDITMTPGTETVSGSVTDSVTGLSIPGVELLLQSTTTNTGTLTFSDANGNFSVAVTPDTYKANLSEKGLGMLGYVRPATKPRITVTTNNVTGMGLGLTKETALIYGSVKTAANQPLAGVSISGSDSSNVYSSSTSTDANGNYILSVVGANTWYFGPDSSSPVLAGYTVQGTNVTLAANQAVNVNFIAQHVSAHLIGHVIDNTGIPQAGITLFASMANSANGAQATTAADGSFDLGVFGGTWDVSVTFNGNSYNWMAPSLVFNVTDGVDITNIAFVVLNSTAAITGWVHDPQGASVPGVNVSASGTVNGTNYFNQVNTDANGNFQLPVANGSWQVGLGNCLNYGCPTNNFQTVVVNGANVVVDFSFVGPAQLSLNFRHFIYGGDFGAGLTPVTPFPISIFQYLAMLTAQNGTGYPPANAVFFTGPAGSGLTGTPATDALSGKNNSMIYFSPGVTNPPTAPGGTWTIGYNGSITNLNIADPQTSARLFAIIPTAVVSGGQLTSISWVYKDTNGVPLAGAPQFVTQVVVQVFDQNLNGLIASPASAPTTTSYSLSPSLPWSGVGRVRMIYFDNLGNRYFLNFPRSVPSVAGAGALANGQFGFQVTGLIFQNYTVQYSTTLSNWSTLYVTNAPASVFSVLDPNATGPYRFYRILLGP